MRSQPLKKTAARKKGGAKEPLPESKVDDLLG